MRINDRYPGGHGSSCARSSLPKRCRAAGVYSFMRYRLRTLMVVAGVVPPAIAAVWFHWGLMLFLVFCVALLAIWLLVSLGLARLLAQLLVSFMLD